MNPAGIPTERRLYRFDDFLVDPVRRLLLRDGRPVAVTPKALSLLLVLLERPGEVIGKSELTQKVWPDSHVTEANLTQNVSFLRKALGERAGDRRYVATLPGQGYSFIGEVVTVVPEDPVPRAEPPAAVSPPEVLPSEPPAEPSPPESGRRSGVYRIDEPVEPVEAAEAAERMTAAPLGPSVPEIPGRGRAVLRRKLWEVAVTLGLLALLVTAALWLRGVGRRSDAARPAGSAAAPAGRTSRPSVAVLGFKNLSGSQKTQWLAPALSEILTTELAAGSNVRMVSGENVARARQALGLPYSESGEGSDLGRLRSLLGADLVVVGSYTFLEPGPGSGADRQIRVDLRVLKLPEGVAVASLTETGTEPNLFDLVAAAGKDLRHSLGLTDLSPDEARQAQALHPASPEAARLYTQGLARLRSYDILAARDRLSQAAGADPGSALIHSALSQAWAQLGYDARALAEARKALELAALLSREQRLELEGRFQAAGRKWGKASEIYRSLWTFFPDDLDYGLRLADSLAQAGRGKEALDTLAALRKLPPPASDDPRIDIAEAEAARSLGDTAALERAAAAAVAKGRRSGEALIVGRALLLRGSVPLFTGRPLEALGPFREAHALYEKAGYRWGVAMADAHIGIAFYHSGDYAAAEKPYREAVEIAQQIGNATGIANGLLNLGLVYQSRGDLAQALSFYERSRAKAAEIDEPALGVWLLHAISTVHLAQGDVAAARRESEQVLTASRQTGDRSHEAQALGNLGTILALHGSLADAREELDRALAILHRGRDPETVIPSLVESVDVLGRLGDAAGARSRAEQGLAAARQAGYRLGVAKILGAFSHLSLRTGDLAAARAQAEEQLRISRELGARDLTAWALQNLGRASLAAGDLHSARGALEESLRDSEAAGEALRAMTTRLDLADLALAEGAPAEAAGLARAAAAWCEPREVRRGEARALSVLVAALLQQGLHAEAQEAAGRMRSQGEKNEDRELRIETAVAVARVDASRGQAAKAVRDLREAIGEAAQTGQSPAGLRARRALGESILAQGDAAAGRAELEAVRKDAEAQGLSLLARQVEEDLKQGIQRGWPPARGSAGES
jgi:DNA-binding winged helix-turn-helix (wHTH) protein/tetratricopeptide (TPR) repeat protein/TolB-like protein